MAGTRASTNPITTMARGHPPAFSGTNKTYIKCWSIPWQKAAKALPESEETVHQYTNIQSQSQTFLWTYSSSYPEVQKKKFHMITLYLPPWRVSKYSTVVSIYVSQYAGYWLVSFRCEYNIITPLLKYSCCSSHLVLFRRITFSYCSISQ